MTNSLTKSREIDVIIYNDLKDNPFFIKILDILEIAFINTAIDLGASSGISALWLLNRLPNVEKIYCFEPDKENYEFLLTNLNQFGDKIAPYNVGIYYGLTESKVYGIGDNNPLGYAIEPIKSRTITKHVFEEYYGKIFTLLELESIVDFPVDFIKMDVEGSEYNIIENSTTLKKARFLFISFHNQDETYVHNIIKEHLSDYEIILFGGAGTYFDAFLERKTEWQKSSS